MSKATSSIRVHSCSGADRLPSAGPRGAWALSWPSISAGALATVLYGARMKRRSRRGAPDDFRSEWRAVLRAGVWRAAGAVLGWAVVLLVMASWCLSMLSGVLP